MHFRSPVVVGMATRKIVLTIFLTRRRLYMLFGVAAQNLSVKLIRYNFIMCIFIIYFKHYYFSPPTLP